MNAHVRNRTLLLAALRRELVGPDPVPGAKSLDLSKLPVFKTIQEMHGPWTEQGSQQEIISQDTPTKRYGVGVLHPAPTTQGGSGLQASQDARRDVDAINQADFASVEDTEAPEGTPDPEGSDAQIKQSEAVKEKVERVLGSREVASNPEETFDISGANGYRPSGMAVSFLADIPEGSVLKVRLPTVLPGGHAFEGMAVNGRYRPVAVQREGKAAAEPKAAQAVPEAVATEAAQPIPSEQTDSPSEVTPDAAPAGEVPTPAAAAQGPAAGKRVKDTLWARVQLEAEYEISGAELLASQGKFRVLAPARSSGLEGLRLTVEILARPYGPAGGTQRLVTVNLVNRTPGEDHPDQRSLFQSYFELQFEQGGEVQAIILPYPKPPQVGDEEQSNALLYRNTPTFATGHGCAADWVSASTERAATLRTECLPVQELPSITPDVKRKVTRDGVEREETIEVPMLGLAGLKPGFNIGDSLQQICDGYEDWIGLREAEIPSLPVIHQPTARAHLEACKRALKRMQRGRDYLVGDATAMQAFKWANHAILLQQIRGDLKPRLATYNAAADRSSISGIYPPVEVAAGEGRGNWRAFQIAFLLLSVESAADGEHDDRDVVELIWFPTGGGKTEAYLGLTAFALFMRRLQDPQDSGVHVLMRYTLRLLTAQQFQRATALICAMEYLRQRHPQALGEAPFSAGIWVGGGTTPNRREDALKTLGKIVKGTGASNPFLLTKCPWCGAQMGPFEHAAPLEAEEEGRARKGRHSRGKPRGKENRAQVSTLGYEDRGTTVALHCPDAQCDFSEDLPVYVIDEDIYEHRPSLIIGTVDKFAMLAWRPEARSIFGIGDDGCRQVSPPGLIIQDELHLIAGPLGSMTGLFEGVLEDLCTDDRDGRAIKPKLVCSTATIRAYREQVGALYARSSTELFPPPGLDVSDSFFAQYAREKDGKTLQRGRLYVGVNGPGHGSMQTTQVRTFSALLQFPKTLNPGHQDPWWTLLTFFNALRELGTTVTLFQSDIPDYMKIIQERYKLDKGAVRSAWNVKELTGRLDSEEVPQAIRDLEITTDNPDRQQPVDVCLASNIIEVGVDIGRLSLMAIVGQPKTTSQYIQVSGRVGRKWWERPGVVVMLYNASKARDRSHFEKFRSYHEQLYAQVEPTSVTPFSPRALDRGLRAALVAFVRQRGDKSEGGPAKSPKTYPEELGAAFERLILDRVDKVDPAEKERVEELLGKIQQEWAFLQKDKYQVTGSAGIDHPGLLTPAGQHVNPAARRMTWMTPQSMRNVDASCEAQITRLPDNDGMRRIQEGQTREQ